jgi:hypothetical protein
LYSLTRRRCRGSLGIRRRTRLETTLWARLLVLCFIFLGTTCSRSVEDWRPEALKPIQSSPTFGISWRNMCAPEGFIVLVRDHGTVAAIAFFDAREGIRPGTGVARYSAYLPVDGRLHFGRHARKQEGSVSVKGWVGFHPFVIQRGEYEIKLGSFRLTYDFPACVSFLGNPYEFAPTPWTRIEDVDAGAPSLRWFHERRMSELSLEISPRELLLGLEPQSGRFQP